MKAHWRRRDALIAGGVLFGLLGGCGSLLPRAPERPLYRLVPTFAFPPGLPQVTAQLAVATPAAADGLDTRRIVLTRSRVALDYFADGEWTDRAPALVATALVDGFEKSGALTAVTPEGLGLRADFVLESELTNFEAAYDSPNAPPRVVVRLDVKLVRLPELKIIAASSLGGEATAAANRLLDIVRAYDEALGRAVTAVVTWTLDNPALSRRPGSVISRTRFVHPSGGREK